MKKISVILGIFFCLNALCVWAEGDYLIEITPTKKIIHVEKLGFSGSTAIMDVLETMPELLARASDNGSVLSNFSIQVDGKDAGQSRDVVLNQMVVAEVDVIEVSTSPTVSEQKNGTGGVINIKLKPVRHDGVGGAAMLDVTTEWDVQPSVMLSYKNDKFLLRSSLRAEYYRPTNYGYSYYNSPDTMMEEFDTTRTSYKQETAKLYMVYNPTTNDQLKVHLFESYGRETDDTRLTNVLFRAAPEMKNVFNRLRHVETGRTLAEELTALAYMSYEHDYTTHEGEFDIEAQYTYMPTRNKNDNYRSGVEGLLSGDSWWNSRNRVQTHEVTGEICSKHVLWRREANMLNLKYGVDATCSFGKDSMLLSESYYMQPTHYDTTANENTKIYASPFLEMNFRYNKWYLQAGARYQYYRVNLNDRRTSLDYVDAHTVTGNVSLSYHVAKDHHLRLIAARNIRRWMEVDEIHIYPYYHADLNYIFEWQNDLNAITMSTSATYIYAQQTKGYTGTASVNAQLVYQHGIFSMAFAGNAYFRTLYGTENAGNRCWYYNLSLLPVLSLKKHWTLSGKIMYNSEMKTVDADYGDCVYTQFRVAKQIRGWNIHAEISDIFDYVTTNTFYKDGQSVYKSKEDLYKRCFLIGFAYIF